MLRSCLPLSYPFNVGFFSFAQCVGLAQLVSGFLSEEKFFSFVAIDSVCPWEEMSSGASYVTILNQNLSV